MPRTQHERRTETVGRLLDASIATIIEVGYARASASAITARANLSDGALFRHFATMGDFMAATAHEVLRRQLELFTKRVADIPPDAPVLEAVLGILRDVTGNATNAVLYELLIAARTDEKLRIALREVLTTYRKKIVETARSLPTSDLFPDAVVPAIVGLVTNSFDGAAILHAVLPNPELEAVRIPLLLSLLGRRAE